MRKGRVELAWEVPSSFWWKSDSFMGTLLLKEETLRPSINTAERCILFLTENGCFLCFSWYSFAPVSYSWICSFFLHCKKQRDCHITMGDKRCNNPLHFQLQSGCRRDNFEISSFQYGNKICEAVTKRNQRQIDKKRWAHHWNPVTLRKYLAAWTLPGCSK